MSYTLPRLDLSQNLSAFVLMRLTLKISGGQLISAMTGWPCPRPLDLDVRRVDTRFLVKMELPHRIVNQYAGMLLLEEASCLRRIS